MKKEGFAIKQINLLITKNKKARFFKATKENDVHPVELINEWITSYTEAHEEDLAAIRLHKEADEMVK